MFVCAAEAVRIPRSVQAVTQMTINIINVYFVL